MTAGVLEMCVIWNLTRNDIKALIIPGPGKYLGCFCRDSEFCIPWAKVIRIGPDIILVEFNEKEMRHKI